MDLSAFDSSWKTLIKDFLHFPRGSGMYDLAIIDIQPDVHGGQVVHIMP